MDRYSGEPKLEEMLSDPIIHLIMKADRIDRRRLCKILVQAGAETRPAQDQDMGAAQGKD